MPRKDDSAETLVAAARGVERETPRRDRAPLEAAENPLRPPRTEWRATWAFGVLCVLNGFDTTDLGAWVPHIPWEFMPWLASVVLGIQVARGAPKAAAAWGMNR